MKPKIQIDAESQTPVYKQIIHAVQDMANTGRYKPGEFIPSMNQLAGDLDISKETVKKAYSILREKGIIESSHGKGFYITEKGEKTTKILLLFDKISTYKQILLHSFSDHLEHLSEVSIRLHNQDISLLEHFIDESLDRFDYYVVTPHFPLDPEIQKRALRALKKIPNRKLILLDRLIEDLPGNFGSVHQDFEQDIFNGLMQGIDTLKKFSKLNVISMPGSLYAPMIEKGVRRFCRKNKINFKIHRNIHLNNIQKQEVYLILNSQLDQELIELARAAQTKGFEIGKDIGVISYNESPINEIVLNGLTVLSTDFEQMGALAAKMIAEKSLKKIRCNFQLIRRNTF